LLLFWLDNSTSTRVYIALLWRKSERKTDRKSAKINQSINREGLELMSVIYMNNETMRVYRDKNAAIKAWSQGETIKVYVPGVSVPIVWEQD
jgi:hypothetical protein